MTLGEAVTYREILSGLLLLLLFSGFRVVAVVVGFATNLLPYMSVTYSTAVVVVAEVVVVLKKGFLLTFYSRFEKALPTYRKPFTFVDLQRGFNIQWESEYRPFQKHWNTELFEFKISNGLVFKWLVYVLCPMYYVLDRPFEYQTST